MPCGRIGGAALGRYLFATAGTIAASRTRQGGTSLLGRGFGRLAGNHQIAFLRRVVEWPSGDRIIPLNAATDSGPRQRFDRAVLAMSPEAAARYWLDARIRSGVAPPREVGDPALTVRLVARLPGTIGYVPADTPRDGVRVIARIRDDRVGAP